MSQKIMVEARQPHGSSNREFGLVFSGFFLMLAVLELFSKLPFSLEFPAMLQCPYLQKSEFAAHPWAPIFALISVVFFLFSLFIPNALSPLNWLWTRFGELLHKIVSPIVLGGLFFLVFTPFGLAMRLFGKDLLRLRLDKNQASYWLERSPPGPESRSFEDQF